MTYFRRSPTRAPSWPAHKPRNRKSGGQRAILRARRDLLVVVENYPVLKSNETFARLMDELAGTENRIATERMRYNERVQQYNTSRRSFPANITASIFGFKEYPLFQVPESAKVAPKVDFSGRRLPPATPKPQ